MKRRRSGAATAPHDDGDRFDRPTSRDRAMNRTSPRFSMRHAGLATLLALGSLQTAQAADVNKGIEQALAAAQESKKGIMVYVGGQAIGGGVVKIEAGQWVELRSQQYGRIVIRLDRIDGIAMP
jgi:putative heme degradation protein